jgi:hypothetical protein
LGVDPLDERDRIDAYGQRVIEDALGDDAPLGERPNAGKARLAFEGATESDHMAVRIGVRYQKGAELMCNAYDSMVKAAVAKQKFSDAVLNIKYLALKHPLLAGEIRDVLAPVYMIIEDTDKLIGNAAGSRDFVDGKDIVRAKAEGGVAAVVGQKHHICDADEQGEMTEAGNSSNGAYNPELVSSKRTSQRKR